MFVLSPIERKKVKVRSKIKNLKSLRLTVYKSNRHIYAQVFTHDGSVVLASASSMDNEFKSKYLNYIKENKINKTEISKLVGSLLVDRIKKLSINNLAFDRSGLKFHGNIKALAEVINNNNIKC